MKTTTAALVVAMCALSLGACASDGSPGPHASNSFETTPPAAGSQPAAPGELDGDPGPGAATADWLSEPVVVPRSVQVPPVPRLMGIRSAPHPDEGFDRVTFDFGSVLPGYEVRYVDEVIADASGEPVDVAGRRFLQIVFRPAQAHDDTGTLALMPRERTLGYPMLQAYAITGDFEGVLTVVLGLDDVVGFRVGELHGTPARIYVDVAA